MNGEIFQNANKQAERLTIKTKPQKTCKPSAKERYPAHLLKCKGLEKYAASSWIFFCNIIHSSNNSCPKEKGTKSFLKCDVGWHQKGRQGWTKGILMWNGNERINPKWNNSRNTSNVNYAKFYSRHWVCKFFVRKECKFRSCIHDCCNFLCSAGLEFFRLY